MRTDSRTVLARKGSLRRPQTDALAGSAPFGELKSQRAAPAETQNLKFAIDNASPLMEARSDSLIFAIFRPSRICELR